MYGVGGQPQRYDTVVQSKILVVQSLRNYLNFKIFDENIFKTSN